MSLNPTPSYSFTIKTTSQTSLSFNGYGDTAVGEANNSVDVLLSTLNNGNYTGDYLINNYSSSGTLNYSVDLATLLSSTSHQLPQPSNEAHLLALSNGNTVVYYGNGDSGQTKYGFNAYFIVLDSSGHMIDGPTQINTLTGSTQTRVLSAAELSNGNVAFAYQRSDNGSLGAQVFNIGSSSVTKVGSEQTIVSSGTAYDVDVAASGNGGFMVAYAPTNSDTHSDYQIFNNSGVLQTSGTAFVDSQTEANPQVVGLSNGDYLYIDGNDAYAGNPIKGEIYTSSGTAVASVNLPAY
jgi:hypothetical protein